MFTVAECRAQAEQKLAQAEHDDANRKRFIVAAEAWLLLAGQLRRAEKAARKRRARSRTKHRPSELREMQSAEKAADSPA
jgi:hypothetical protein